MVDCNDIIIKGGNSNISLEENGRLFPLWIMSNFKKYILPEIIRKDGEDPCNEKITNELEKYQQLLAKTDLNQKKSAKTAPYNLLMTREWMMVIPRSQESYQDISINSLGFAGALLVRNPEQMEQLKQIGPLTFLQKVGIKKTSSEARNT